MAAVKYQVFISSTSKDLREERRKVIDALLESSSFIPVGMELFNATSEAAWPTIERIIQPCDYYIVIVAGRYGAERPTGLSFTESEYEYARRLNKPVLAFLHRRPEMQSDEEVGSIGKVLGFRRRLEDELTCKYWESADELARHVVISLNGQVTDNPQTGWVRADTIGLPPEQLQHDIVAPCEELGISRISVDGQAGQALSTAVANSRTVRIMSTSATRLVEIQKPYLARAVARGCDLRVLVPSTDAEFLRDVDEAEKRNDEDSIANEVRQAPRRLAEIRELALLRAGHADGELGRIQLGHFSTHLRSTLVLCDDLWGWITVTLPPARAAETASFELIGGSLNPLLDDCIRHFDRTWDIVDGRGGITTIE